MNLTLAEGFSISSNQRKQLTSGMVDAADKVIVMAERETWPEYLAESAKVSFWEVGDMANAAADGPQGIVDQIKASVEELVEAIG